MKLKVRLALKKVLVQFVVVSSGGQFNFLILNATIYRTIIPGELALLAKETMQWSFTTGHLYQNKYFIVVLAATTLPVNNIVQAATTVSVNNVVRAPLLSP
ncbi:MAG: hypothetical protein C4K58_08620 [Flavobacteriaceae bacterium]|nr:MAG: hypothetical protein C4K58_08620 [Flavobacteriaceae bacterium]